jgi:RsiW-degrading membrane proteinase PrsW (M82 family)
MEDFTVNHPEVFVLVQFVNAFCVAALVEELMKYFAYRMVVTPETITQRGQSSSSSSTSSSKSTGSAITVAVSLRGCGCDVTITFNFVLIHFVIKMVSTALGFACCENLVYIFIYSPPSLDNQISTLLARSFFPVHPLCAAIQSIGVCRRDLEGDKSYGLGRIILPAFLLHGSFDFVLMLASEYCYSVCCVLNY